MIDTAEQRTSVWEYVNPVAITKFAYTSPLGSALYGPYRALAQGRGLMIPSILPQLPSMGGTAVKFSQLSSVVSDVIGSNRTTFMTNISRASKTFGRGVLFGLEGIGAGSTTQGMEAMAIARRGLVGWKEVKVKQIAKTASSTTKGIMEVEKVLGAKSLMRAGGPGVPTMGRAGLIMAGRVVNPIMNIILAAQVISFAAETTFKGIRATTEAINRAAERVYSLDLGGELSRGYLTAGAATERQRALQAIQGSHLAGRRFLGNEASLLHG